MLVRRNSGDEFSSGAGERRGTNRLSVVVFEATGPDEPLLFQRFKPGTDVFCGGIGVEPGMFGDLLNQLEFSERTFAQSAQDYEFVLSEVLNTRRIDGHLLYLFLHR